MDIIYTHAHCQDGWVAAYVAQLSYPDAEIVPLNHYPDQKWIVEKSVGKDVLMLDFALKTRAQNDELAAACKSFQILDHHKTAKEALDGAPYATFDMNRSGAGLAWDLVHNTFKLPIRVDGVETGEFIHALPEPRPWWVNYTEAQDLWRWESLPDSKEVAGYLRTIPFQIPDWDYVRESLSKIDALRLGLGVQSLIDYEVREMVQRVASGHLFGHTCGVVNAGLNRAQICNEIAKKYDVAMGWFERGIDDQIQFFLCSDNGTDVGEIAKRLGGGGHANAAGFEKPIVEARRLIDTILDRNGEYGVHPTQAVSHG